MVDISPYPEDSTGPGRTLTRSLHPVVFWKKKKRLLKSYVRTCATIQLTQCLNNFVWILALVPWPISNFLPRLSLQMIKQENCLINSREMAKPHAGISLFYPLIDHNARPTITFRVLPRNKNKIDPSPMHQHQSVGVYNCRNGSTRWARLCNWHLHLSQSFIICPLLGYQFSQLT